MAEFGPESNKVQEQRLARAHLSQGVLEDNFVSCPKHHTKFDVTTGKVSSSAKFGPFQPETCDERTYQIKVENENIMVKL